MKAFIKGLIHHHPVLFTDEFGPLVGNYLDDIWFIATTEEKNTLQLLVAEWWAKWLGIELNDDKRELPRTSTRHLGFQIDLRNKIVSVTTKHRQRCISFFDLFMACVRTKGRIPTKKLQKIFGFTDMDKHGVQSDATISHVHMRYTPYLTDETILLSA